MTDAEQQPVGRAWGLRRRERRVLLVAVAVLAPSTLLGAPPVGAVTPRVQSLPAAVLSFPRPNTACLTYPAARQVCETYGIDGITITYSGLPPASTNYSYDFSYSPYPDYTPNLQAPDTLVPLSVPGGAPYSVFVRTLPGTYSGVMTIDAGDGFDETEGGAPGDVGSDCFHTNKTVIAGVAGARTFVAPAVGIANDNALNPGYFIASSSGDVCAQGSALRGWTGDLSGVPLNAPIVGVASTPDGAGYWAVATDGGVFDFGDARFYGSVGDIHLNQPIVGIAPTPTGGGYWLVARDGGVFDFGDAHFYGSTGNVRLSQPVVGMTPTPNGDGYWLVAADGGVFQFGAAGFHGSLGSTRLNEPITAVAGTADGGGYTMVASDGGVFNFGSSHFYGSLGAAPPADPVVGISSAREGGYRLLDAGGAVYDFGPGASNEGGA